jgi:hypothetical protein
VDCLKKEIDASIHTHTEKVEELTDEKNQLLKESEAFVETSFSSLQNAVSELSIQLSTQMNTIKEVVQSTKEDVHLTKAQLLQADTSKHCLKPSSPLLPEEMKQCNTELASTQEKLLLTIERDREAQTKLHAEEVRLREMFLTYLLTYLLDESEIEAKIKKVKVEIN